MPIRIIPHSAERSSHKHPFQLTIRTTQAIPKGAKHPFNVWAGPSCVPEGFHSKLLLDLKFEHAVTISTSNTPNHVWSVFQKHDQVVGCANGNIEFSFLQPRLSAPGWKFDGFQVIDFARGTNTASTRALAVFRSSNGQSKELLLFDADGLPFTREPHHGDRVFVNPRECVRPTK